MHEILQAAALRVALLLLLAAANSGCIAAVNGKSETWWLPLSLLLLCCIHSADRFLKWRFALAVFAVSVVSLLIG